MSWPSIDHGMLSPSGHVSKRFEKRAKAEARRILFPDGFPGPLPPPQLIRHDRLLREASQLRELAACGMRPRAFIRRAEQLEAEAQEF